MANIKELRGRIKSVSNIAKITKAMEMVASMKLRKVQNRALSHAAYTRTLYGIMSHLARHVGEDIDRPLSVTREEIRNIGVFLITSDRGLCGAYNANVLNEVQRLRARLEAEGSQAKLKFYVVGRKGYTWLSRRGYEVVRFYADPALEALDFVTARVASDDLVQAFRDEEVDEVVVLATAFRSVARFEPLTVKFLPLADLEPPRVPVFSELTFEQVIPGRGGYLLEPDPDTLIQEIVPKYLQTLLFDAMLESLASEMASRRMAMKGATDAATRMGKELRKKYNRARQESITKELLDIVGGTNAVS